VEIPSIAALAPPILTDGLSDKYIDPPIKNSRKDSKHKKEAKTLPQIKDNQKVPEPKKKKGAVVLKQAKALPRIKDSQRRFQNQRRKEAMLYWSHLHSSGSLWKV
jgi:hypothetical protein